MLQFSWQLSTNGHLVQQGTSDKQLLGAYAKDFIEMEFLYFEATPGQPYSLELEFTKDGRELAGTNPTLRVGVDSWDSSDTTMVLGGALLVSAGCIVWGVRLS